MPRGSDIWLGKQRGDVKATQRDRDIVDLAIDAAFHLTPSALESFVGMAEQLKLGNRALSDNQRGQVEAALKSLGIALPPKSEKIMGKTEDEKPGRRPAVLSRLPLRPPSKLTPDDWRDS